MNFSPKQLAKAKEAASADELLALANENGIEMTAEEAKAYFAELNKEGELADDELGNVAGGCGECTVRTTWAPVCDGRFVPLGDLPFVNCGYCKYFELKDNHGYGVCHRDDK